MLFRSKMKNIRNNWDLSALRAASVVQYLQDHFGVNPKRLMVEKAGSLDYTVGDSVKHIKFGVGIVEAITDGGRDFEVTVNFDKYGVKKMFAGFAKLKKI